MAAAAKVCVTGGTGFIGAWVVDACLRAGFTVHTTVRAGGSPAKLAPLRALAKDHTSSSSSPPSLELFTADLSDVGAGGFADALAGCEALIHTATPIYIPIASRGQSPMEEAEAVEKQIRPAVDGQLSAGATGEGRGERRVLSAPLWAARSPRKPRTPHLWGGSSSALVYSHHSSIAFPTGQARPSCSALPTPPGSSAWC